MPIGVSRVPISTGSDYYLSLQYFAPHQIAYAQTLRDRVRELEAALNGLD